MKNPSQSLITVAPVVVRRRYPNRMESRNTSGILYVNEFKYLHLKANDHEANEDVH